MRRLTSICSIGLSLLGAPSAWADKQLNTPFLTSNMNPLVQVYGLPASRDAIIADKGQWQTGLQFEAANTFSSGDNSSEDIFLDGESYRSSLFVNYGLTEKLEVGIELQYISQDGGQLDSLIEDWHSLWNLPNGNRDHYDQDQLQYSYAINGQQLLDLDNAVNGFGDTTLMLAYQFLASDDTYWSLRGGVKLPSGDADKLSGSDSTDIYLGLHGSTLGLFGNPALFSHGSVGVLWMSDGEVLEQVRNDWVSYGSGAIGWMASERISLKAQIDFHSAFYDSGLEEIGEFSAQLVFGGSIRASNNTVVDISMSEDIVVNASPDVVFLLGVRSDF
jgi:hypothetical protein